eukprot:GHVT01066057.1.p1 GENE.GHVT01066057.1~~GHVT01066057.1.p1  ORF type:complete len:404 (-),score=67.55 GHVT01066057.1:1046-2257(-)
MRLLSAYGPAALITSKHARDIPACLSCPVSPADFRPSQGGVRQSARSQSSVLGHHLYNRDWRSSSALAGGPSALLKVGGGSHRTSDPTLMALRPRAPVAVSESRLPAHQLMPAPFEPSVAPHSAEPTCDGDLELPARRRTRPSCPPGLGLSTEVNGRNGFSLQSVELAPQASRLSTTFAASVSSSFSSGPTPVSSSSSSLPTSLAFPISVSGVQGAAASPASSSVFESMTEGLRPDPSHSSSSCLSSPPVASSSSSLSPPPPPSSSLTAPANSAEADVRQPAPTPAQARSSRKRARNQESLTDISLYSLLNLSISSGQRYSSEKDRGVDNTHNTFWSQTAFEQKAIRADAVAPARNYTIQGQLESFPTYCPKISRTHARTHAAFRFLYTLMRNPLLRNSSYCY